VEISVLLVNKEKKENLAKRVIKAIKVILDYPAKMVEMERQERKVKREIREILDNEVRRATKENPETRGYYLYLTPWHMKI
jgi:hypothetical protein